jgi:hypothetical protein
MMNNIKVYNYSCLHKSYFIVNNNREALLINATSLTINYFKLLQSLKVKGISLFYFNNLEGRPTTSLSLFKQIFGQINLLNRQNFGYSASITQNYPLVFNFNGLTLGYASYFINNKNIEVLALDNSLILSTWWAISLKHYSLLIPLQQQFYTQVYNHFGGNDRFLSLLPCDGAPFTLFKGKF